MRPIWIVQYLQEDQNKIGHNGWNDLHVHTGTSAISGTERMSSKSKRLKHWPCRSCSFSDTTIATPMSPLLPTSRVEGEILFAYGYCKYLYNTYSSLSQIKSRLRLKVWLCKKCFGKLKFRLWRRFYRKLQWSHKSLKSRKLAEQALSTGENSHGNHRLKRCWAPSA